jgi:hypothetical protein
MLSQCTVDHPDRGNSQRARQHRDRPAGLILFQGKVGPDAHCPYGAGKIPCRQGKAVRMAASRALHMGFRAGKGRSIMTDATPNSELPKTFDPAAIEAKWYEHWETNGLFRPERPGAQPFTIVNPPPNVTGSLHIGHALDNTLQDVVIRYERLRGKDALWVVGMDHAGIATQMVVERQLEERQDKRTNYTREQFVEKVWQWKAESGGAITGQLRRLGCSMDWSREQFTMDPHFTGAVVKVFVDLYNRGLIYRDKRLVNWDPKLKTAISDLEVETHEVKGHFWRFRYPFADGSGHVEVATTRPETMLADMAVAVHPEDPRYQAAIGKEILQPITGRRFKVVADEHADPELGSGVVKITPGHDFNDFEVGKRAGIKPADMLNMFDAEARVVQTADGLVPDEFLGLDRFVARELVVADSARHEGQGRQRKRGRRRTARDPAALWRPRRRADRAVADRPVVRQRRGTGQGAARSGPLRRGRDRAQDLGKDLLQLDGKHPAVVRFPPAVVGAPDSGVVRCRRQCLRGRDRGSGAGAGR